MRGPACFPSSARTRTASNGPRKSSARRCRRRSHLQSRVLQGTSGVLKDALEWVVGGGELAGKPIAVVTTLPSMTGGDWAQAWVKETFKVKGALVQRSACPFPAPVPRSPKAASPTRRLWPASAKSSRPRPAR
ncbi:NAD(P)H-dependent oxidoreductase [Streptomyces sp. ICN988]|uniref:NAD(P)H-dependent oxidoreductase n=1 Tax=Streptomyces sp. ICN988 TaxID=2983765 RepID=UPI00398CD83F